MSNGLFVQVRCFPTHLTNANIDRLFVTIDRLGAVLFKPVCLWKASNVNINTTERNIRYTKLQISKKVLYKRFYTQIEKGVFLSWGRNFRFKSNYGKTFLSSTPTFFGVKTSRARPVIYFGIKCKDRVNLWSSTFLKWKVSLKNLNALRC